MSKILDALIVAGVASNVIGEVAMLESEVRRLAEYRERARLRMRAVRERSRNARTVENSDEHDSASIEEERKKVSKKEESKRESQRASRASPAKIPLPENWSPEEELSPAELGELEKMRDWARANAIRKADWSATWRNWKRRAPEFNGRTNGNGRSGSVLEAADKLISRLNAAGAGNYTPGSRGPQSLEVDSFSGPSSPRLISSR